MKWLKTFFAFWYDFIVGDDWRCAVGVILSAALVELGTHHAINAWWIIPLVTPLILGYSLHVATKKQPNS